MGVLALESALLKERIATLEGCLSRLADDARAALSESTYARLEHEHRLMLNTLDALRRGLVKRSSDRDLVLLALVTSALNEVMPSEGKLADA